MRRVLVLLTCGLIAIAPGCAFHRSATKSLAEKRSREKEARAAAGEWLALIDTADYAAAYAREPGTIARGDDGGTIRPLNGRPARALRPNAFAHIYWCGIYPEAYRRT